MREGSKCSEDFPRPPIRMTEMPCGPAGPARTVTASVFRDSDAEGGPDELETQILWRRRGPHRLYSLALVMVERSFCECPARHGLWVAGQPAVPSRVWPGGHRGLLADQRDWPDPPSPGRSENVGEQTAGALYPP